MLERSDNAISCVLYLENLKASLTEGAAELPFDNSPVGSGMSSILPFRRGRHGHCLSAQLTPDGPVSGAYGTRAVRGQFEAA